MPANNLPSLRSDFDQLTAVQRTTFSIDAPGRFLCHTLSEALSPEVPSGPGLALTADFDAIVIGSGMYGAFCADRLVRNGAKVLVLEAGPFLTGQHVQNPPNIGLPFGANVVGSVGNQATDETDALVWGLPWRGNQEFGRLAFCVGGKSVFWGGWAPRLTDDVLDEALPGGVTWPAEVASYLRTYYPRIELQMGVSELKVLAAGQASTPVVRTDLFNSAENKLTAVLEAKLNSLVGNVSVGPGGATRTLVEGIDPAPIAVQADAPASGVFAFNKFSSLPLLLATSREDFALSGGDQLRRLFIVPNVRVLGLDYDPNAKRVTGIRISQAPGRVGVGPHTRVVLALSAIESTRLAQASFGAAPRAAKLQGRNLMAHLRNNFSVRIKRSALNILPGASLQTAAFHIRCKASNGLRYHFQYYAGFQPGNTAESLLYSSIVHTDTVQGVLANQDPEWVAMTFRGCGEMIGQTSRATGDDGASYVNLSNEIDQFGDRRAWVNLVQQREDLQAFDEMDEAGFALALGLAGNNPANIEYFDAKENKFVPQNPYARGGDRFGLLRGEGKGGIRDGLGTTYHDCGTLWMGEDPNTSVTDPNGRFHDATNVYCADQALFPRGGSANPVPTGLLLARRAAEAIVNGDLQVVGVEVGGEVVAHHYAVEPGFEPLFVFDRDPVPAPPTTGKTIPNLPRGWKHLGDGTFTSQGLSIETRGGIGLLIYEADQNLKDFVLRLQWRAPTIRNNSGVYVRLPSALLTDAGKLIKTGYEVQIDNTGERPGDQKDFPFPTESFNPFHITGAVYPVHPTDGFPTQLPQPNGAPARLDVPTRDLALWNDLEITARGNRIAILLNGQPTLTSGDYVDQANRYPSGLIALQNHFKGLRVQFRHVRLKRL